MLKAKDPKATLKLKKVTPKAKEAKAKSKEDPPPKAKA